MELTKKAYTNIVIQGAIDEFEIDRSEGRHKPNMRFADLSIIEQIPYYRISTELHKATCEVEDLGVDYRVPEKVIEYFDQSVRVSYEDFILYCLPNISLEDLLLVHVRVNHQLQQHYKVEDREWEDLSFTERRRRILNCIANVHMRFGDLVKGETANEDRAFIRKFFETGKGEN